MKTNELQRRLAQVGFDPGPEDGVEGPKTRAAVARFQLACALPGHNLVVDGLPGPRTHSALRVACRTGKLSPNFTVAELRTRTRQGGPKDGECWVHRDLLHALERLRSHKGGRPVPVVSGFRDEQHNRRVGGAARSQHTYGQALELQPLVARIGRVPTIAGRAADIPRNYIHVEEARALRIFSGMGVAAGWVTHVDVRAGVPPESPRMWRYS